MHAGRSVAALLEPEAGGIGSREPSSAASGHAIPMHVQAMPARWLGEQRHIGAPFHQAARPMPVPEVICRMINDALQRLRLVRRTLYQLRDEAPQLGRGNHIACGGRCPDPLRRVAIKGFKAIMQDRAHRRRSRANEIGFLRRIDGAQLIHHLPMLDLKAFKAIAEGIRKQRRQQ